MPISAASVASLRARTGVPMMKCKEALEQANGDEEKAIEILRKSGVAAAVKKANRAQNEGIVFAAERHGRAAMIRLDCETDFVARDETFQTLGREIAGALLESGMEAMRKLADEKIPEVVQKLGENISIGEMRMSEASVNGVYIHSNGKIGVIVGLSSGSPEAAREIAMHAAAMNPLYVSPESVAEADIAREREIWKEQLAREGKPEAIIGKIMMGKEKKYREENALLTQEFVKEPGKLVKDLLGGAEVVEYVRFSVK